MRSSSWRQVLLMLIVAAACLLSFLTDSAFVAAQKKKRLRKLFKALPLCSIGTCACFKKCRFCRARRGACRTGGMSIRCCGGSRRRAFNLPPARQRPPEGTPEDAPSASELISSEFGSLFNSSKAVAYVSSDEFTYFENDFELLSGAQYNYDEYYETEVLPEGSDSVSGGVGERPSRSAAPCKTFLEVLQQQESLKTLLRVIKQAPMAIQEEVASKSPVGTLLAPNDAAFSALASTEELEEFLNDQVAVYNFLTQHSIPDRALLTTLFTPTPSTTNTTNSRPLTILSSTDPNTSAIQVSFVGPFGGNSASVATGDLKTCNGVVHVIDGVLAQGNDAFAEVPENTIEAPGFGPGLRLPPVLVEKIRLIRAWLEEVWGWVREKFEDATGRKVTKKDDKDHDSSEL